YFNEINTYIPPWHVVVSQLSEVDLVREHIRIVSGQALSVFSPEPHSRSHVIGVSVNAEDPMKDFAPSPGTLTQFEVPLATGAAIFATAKSGDLISSFYEPVIAQAVAVDSSRDSAITKLRVALSEFIIEGVKTNLPLLRAILELPEFKAGDVDSSLLLDKDSLKELLEKTRIDTEEDIAALIAALTLHNDTNSEQIINAAGRSEGFSIWNFTARLLNRNSMEI
ncbi:MAG: hypothetical protein GYA55_10670, partial [SAR324 cluster bacterium]|nr:hypothetical protein [SAR324 cluster bacterium]